MTQPPATDRPHTVLIATSSPFALAPLQQVLGRYDFHVEALTRGDAMLTAAQAGAVALVLLDVTLAGSASFELCQRLAAMITGGRRLPVFLLSAAPSEEERQRALQAGASAYLRLPGEADEIAEQILIELGVLSAPPAQVGNPAQVGMQVNYHTMMAASPDSVLLLNLDNGRLLDVNRSARQLFGLTEVELLHADLAALLPATQPDGRDSAALFASQMAQVLAGDVRVFEATFRHSSGREVACEMRMVALTRPEHRLMHIRIVDISARKRAEALRDGKNMLLEMIAGGAPLHATLDQLMLLIEGQSEGVLCSIVLLSEDGQTLEGGAGPSLPAAYLASLNGLRIGPDAGSCGSAMYLRQPVVVADLMHDARWAPYRHLAEPYGLRACWSMPILRDKDHVLGSFAMYYKEVRSPTDEERKLIAAAGDLAGIAIASTRREDELRRHREHLEELVAARTAELRQAKDEAEHANEELTTALDNLSLTQDELVRRDKLAALGALVAGVAHELNTPIGNSLMMASSMSQRTAALRNDMVSGLRRSVLEEYLRQAASADEVVLRNLNRAAHLVDSFKRIAVDSASSARRQFDLRQLVTELMLPLQAAHRGNQLQVVIEIPAGIGMDSYPGPLDQALSNLFENSILHGFDGRTGGVITLSARDDVAGEIALSLADNGAGIPAANLTRIYDPFFTTRLGSGGSGLGLYITHNIVCGVLGGRISVSSEEGVGTTFTLYLPLVAPR
jgi:PAS domain S-box-containing protein